MTTLVEWDQRRVPLTGKPVSHKFWRTVQADTETYACGLCNTVHSLFKPGGAAYAVKTLDGWLPLYSLDDLDN